MKYITSILALFMVSCCPLLQDKQSIQSDLDDAKAIPGIPKSAFVYYPLGGDKANFYTAIALAAVKEKYPNIDVSIISKASVHRSTNSRTRKLEGDEVRVSWSKLSKNTSNYSFIDFERRVEVSMSTSGEVHEVIYTNNTK
jgi:hypothetical protein